MENFSYTQALADVEAILERINRQPCDVDTLAEQTARAMELLAQCRARLLAAETDLRTVITGER
jgi:exodeoxyribonuclease VII small subunit